MLLFYSAGDYDADNTNFVEDKPNPVEDANDCRGRLTERLVGVSQGGVPSGMTVVTARDKVHAGVASTS